MLSPRWLALHVLAVVLAAAFLALGWWQLGRGEAGNLRSYAYALEWPTFALFVLFMWWRVIQDSRVDSRPEAQPRANPGVEPEANPKAGPQETEGSDRQPEPGDEAQLPRVLTRLRPAPVPPTEEPDERLAAYNRYLADLNAGDGQQRTW